MISNRLNKFSIRKYTVGTASILVGTTLIFGLGNQEAKAAENTSTENAKQDEASTSADKEVMSNTENNSTTEKMQRIQLRKKQILIHKLKLKKNQKHLLHNNSKIILQLQLKLSLKLMKIIM